MSLELDCPSGGHFYVCESSTTQFLGCCAVDPCADGTGDCPQAALRNASYSSADYDAIPEQACVTSGLWYTCADTSPPFMGCCDSNPCQDGGCFGANLTAARLSDNTTDASPFMTSKASSGEGDGTRPLLSTGAIIGIAIGSALAALGIGVLLFMLYQRRGKMRQQEQQHRHSSSGEVWPIETPTLDTQTPYQDSTGFPSSQFPCSPGSPPYSSEKVVSHQSFPSSEAVDQRPASVSPSWLSGTSTDPARHMYHASVSSIGSQGGLNALFSQPQRQQQQQLSAVSEIDGTEMMRPISELAGTSPQHKEEEHTYGAGYNRVSTSGGR